MIRTSLSSCFKCELVQSMTSILVSSDVSAYQSKYCSINEKAPLASNVTTGHRSQITESRKYADDGD